MNPRHLLYLGLSVVALVALIASAMLVFNYRPNGGVADVPTGTPPAQIPTMSVAPGETPEPKPTDRSGNEQPSTPRPPETPAPANPLAKDTVAKSVDPDVAGTALFIAARSGDAPLFDRFLDAAGKSTDRQDRRRLLAALGGFRDPALIDRALGLVLSGNFDIRETQALFTGINAEQPGREKSFAWLKSNFDLFTKMIPHQMLGRMPAYAGSFCDEKNRGEVEAFFNDRKIQQYDGGTRTLAQTLERIQLCTAYRAAQAPSVHSFLAAN